MAESVMIRVLLAVVIVETGLLVGIVSGIVAFILFHSGLAALGIGLPMLFGTIGTIGTLSAIFRPARKQTVIAAVPELDTKAS